MVDVSSQSNLRLKAGEFVEVKSKEEVLATLDQNGCLEGLPFMPEMFRHCGQRFKVYKRAHKTCDTVFPVRSRRMSNAVHLETRCDGSAHGGCQAGCLIFWKEAWLRRVDAKSVAPIAIGKAAESLPHDNQTSCREADVWNATSSGADKPRYVCQATQLPYATTDLKWSQIDQYVEDLRSRNVTGVAILKGFTFQALNHLKNKRFGIGRIARWLYNNVSPLSDGIPWPIRTGSIAVDQPTPKQVLGLQPGELVRIKSYEEILRTVNTRNRNRGMVFDREMVPYCGGVYRVLKRVDRIVDEKTGEMLEMKTPCIILDSVVCEARYSECRMFCPRSIYSYWREVWLERVAEAVPARELSTT